MTITTTTQQETPAAITPKKTSVVHNILHQLWSFTRSSPLNLIAVILVATAIFSAIVAGLGDYVGIQFTPYDPLKPNLTQRLEAPSFSHLMGTDHIGRDTFSRVVYGTRVSVQMAVTVLSIASLFGMVVGLVAGFFGKWVDEILMRFADLFLAFPALILAAAISAAFGGGLGVTAIALAAVFWPWYARVTRSRVLSLREQQFVRATASLGASNTWLIFRTLMPLIWPVLIVQVTLDVGFAMLASAGLSFLGLGAQAPTAEWGSMILQSISFQPKSWWIAVFPGLALGLTAMGFNLLGDGLRDFLDPSVSDGVKVA